MKRELKVLTTFNKKDKYYSQIIDLAKEFWKHLQKIEPVKTIQITFNFEKEYRNYVKMLMRYNCGSIVIALIDDKVVGFALSYVWGKPKYMPSIIENTQTVELDELYVNSKYRNQSIGTLLINEVIKTYRDIKCTHMVIGLFSSNKRAYKLYKKYGFKDNIIELKRELL